MSTVDRSLQSLQQARSALALSWQRTAEVWRDGRAREYEARHLSEIERATRQFEVALSRLGREVTEVARRLPR